MVRASDIQQRADCLRSSAAARYLAPAVHISTCGAWVLTVQAGKSTSACTGEKGESGFATLRRSLAAGEDAMAAADTQSARWRFVASQPSKDDAATATVRLSPQPN